MKGVNIFGTIGSTDQLNVGTRPAFITFAGTTGKSLTSILYATAPLTGVDIRQSVDYNITKGLDKNFLIAAFGDQPTTITLSGLNIYGNNQKSDQIPKFYAENKISTDLKKRIDVGIAGLKGGAQAFRCALVSLDIQASHTQTVSGLYAYKMTLVGVAL